MSYQQPPAYGAPSDGGLYFISIMGQEQGPLDVNQMRQMAVHGQLRGDVPVRSVDHPNVFPAKHVPGLFSDREWLVTLLLAIFVGWLGVDRFYLGHIGLGVAKIIVCVVTCGFGGAIWQVVDIILIATRKMKDSQGRPLP